MKKKLTSMWNLKKKLSSSSSARVSLRRSSTMHSPTSSSVAVSGVTSPPPMAWCGGRNTALMDQIHAFFSDQTTDDPPSRAAADAAADAAMSALGLRLTERLVVEVVNHKEDVLSSLKFFHWAGRQKGFFHTHTTFLAIFKAMWRQRVGPAIPGFLEGYVLRRRVEHNMRLYDVLVMGYSLAGRPDTALRLLGNVRFMGRTLDVCAYHVLLNSLVDRTDFDTFAVVLGQIRSSGLSNEVTDYLVVKRLCRQGRADEAVVFLRRLPGPAVHGHMVGCLVEALCRDGRHALAAGLVNEFEKAGMVAPVHAYGAWVKSLVRGRPDVKGYIPKLFRYNSLVGVKLKGGRLEEVFELIVEMFEKGMGPDRVTMLAALWSFCRAGMVAVAVELCRTASGFRLFPSSVGFDYVIRTLCGDVGAYRTYTELRKSFGMGCFSEGMAFSIVADVVSREGRVERMREVIELAAERGTASRASTYNMFIASLCLSGKVDDAFLLFRELEGAASRNTFSGLIASLVAAERGGSAARVLIEMEDVGHAPSRRLFNSVVGCLLRMDNARQCVFKLLELYVSKHGRRDRVYGAFIYAAGRGGRPDVAREVFDAMKEGGVVPSLKSISRMLFAYMRGGEISGALNLFAEISRTMRIRRRLYTSIIIGLCKAGVPEMAVQKLEEAKGNKVTPCLECYENLVKLFCSEGRYDDVAGLVRELYAVGRHVTSFLGNTLLLHACDGMVSAWRRKEAGCCDRYMMLGRVISVFADRVNVGPVIRVLEEAIGRCFPPNIYTYNLILARLMAGEMDQASELFNTLCRRGYEPNNWTFDILAQGFFKKGRLAEAKGLVRVMSQRGFEPSKKTTFFMWNQCRK